MILNPAKVLRLEQLESELIAAGYAVHGLTSVDDPATEVYTYDANGNIIDLPNGADAVVLAHVPSYPPVALPPDIPGMVAAIQNSPSLDVPTKTNLISALQGK